jgi:hypothetical protein
MSELFMSIGPTCRSAYHLRRRLNGEVVRGVFDWQVTPTAALVQYLERDFSGVLDFLDLEQTPLGVRNKRLDTLHPHLFRGPFPLSYPEARATHDRRCARTRDVLRADTPLVLCLSDPGQDEAVISAALRKYNPRLRYRFLSPVGGADGPDWRGNFVAWDEALDHQRA